MANRFSLLAGIVCLALMPLPMPGAPAPPLSSPAAGDNPLQQKVKFSVSKGEDLVAAVQDLAQKASAGVNVETLLSNDQYRTDQDKVYAKGFTIAPGTYSLEGVLESIKTVLPGLRWSRDGRDVDVVIVLSEKVSDPFNQELKADVHLTQSTRDWLGWLDRYDQSLGIFEVIPSDMLNPDLWYQIAGPVYFHQSVIVLPQHTKLRVLMNSLADQSHGHWFATVRDKNPIESYRVVNGKNTLMNFEPNSLRGRTEVYFSPVLPNR